MKSEQLIDKILGCPSLPTIPGVAAQVLEMVEDPSVSAGRIASTLEKDPALAARVLRAADLMVPREVATLRHAVVILGTRSVSSLALGVSLTSVFRQSPIHNEGLEETWRRSLYSAIAARMLAARTGSRQGEEAFFGGLFQDIGALGMMAVLGTEYESILNAAGDHEALPAAETQALGIDHAAVGATMAKAWSLPSQILMPIACHHRPQEAPAEERGVVDLVWASRVAAGVLLARDTASAAQSARGVLGRQFNLGAEQIQELLEKLAVQTRELADLFDVRVLSAADTDRVLARAQEALLRTTVEANAEARRLRDDNRKLAEEAGRDRLTGLNNRARLEQVKNAFFESARAEGRPAAVLFLDADRFKSVNDLYGHAAGDEVLRRLSRLVSAAFGDGVFRFGGEEIVCLLSGLDVRQAVEAAERLRRQIEAEVIESDGQRIPVTVSIGVAAIGAPGSADAAPRTGDAPQAGGVPHPAETIEHIIVAADKAMYEAKRAGRNRVRAAAGDLCPA